MIELAGKLWLPRLASPGGGDPSFRAESPPVPVSPPASLPVPPSPEGVPGEELEEQARPDMATTAMAMRERGSGRLFMGSPASNASDRPLPDQREGGRHVGPGG